MTQSRKTFDQCPKSSLDEDLDEDPLHLPEDIVTLPSGKPPFRRGFVPVDRKYRTGIP
jgi:hypothetical protein